MTATRRRIAGSVATLCIVLISGCSRAPVPPVAVPPVLEDGWQVASAESAGFDPAALAALTQEIHDGVFPNTHALLIEHAGKLVHESYYTGTDERWGDDLGERTFDRESLHDVRSISKSVTSTLVGIALGTELDAAVERPVTDFLPGWQLPEATRAITLHHLLTMTPGLTWNEMTVPYTDSSNDEIRLYSVSNPAEVVLNRPLEHEPGSQWYYSGGTTQVLATILHERNGKPLDAYAREALFEPLGIENFEWLGPGGWTPDDPAAMSGLRMTGRALAKIGSVFLNAGRWNGRQVVPERWVELSMKRWVEEISDWSRDGVWGYGYQWWSGRLPQGYRIVAGFGNGNQRLFILPELKLVVTVLAGEYNVGGGHSERLLDRVLDCRAESS